MTQGVDKQIGTLPAIEAERHLVQVGREMLCADLVPASNDSALEERERGFDGIGCDAVPVLVTRVLLRHVIDGFMRGISNRFRVGWQSVGNDNVNIGANIVTNVLSQCARLGIFGVKEPQIAVALPNANHYLLIGRSLSASGITLFSADIGFIHFDSTVKHGPIYFFHGRTDAMAEIPRGLIGTFVLAPDRALELVGAHALLGFAEQKRSEKPLLQRQMRVIENRSSRDGKLVIAVLAVEQLLFGFQFHGWHLAAHTFNATGPAETDKQLAAFFVSVEQVNNVN
jgi:hypothetical protein